MRWILLLSLGAALVLSVNGLYSAAKQKRDHIDIKGELAKTLKDNLHKIFQEIHDAIDKGHEVTSKLLDKAKELVQKLKDIGVSIEDKTRNIFKEIRDKAKDWLKEALDNLGLSKIRSKHAVRSLDRSDLKIIFLKLMEMIADKVDVEKVIQFIEDNFGNLSDLTNTLVETLKKHGIDGLRDVLHLILGMESSRSRRALNVFDLLQNLKDFFKNSGFDLNIINVVQYQNFFRWVFETIQKGFDLTRPFIENLKKLAEEFIDAMQVVGKEVAREALGFFGLYKKDLGDLFTRMEKNFNQLFG